MSDKYAKLVEKNSASLICSACSRQGNVSARIDWSELHEETKTERLAILAHAIRMDRDVSVSNYLLVMGLACLHVSQEMCNQSASGPSSANLTPDQANTYMRSADLEILWALARNRLTPGEILAGLTLHDDPNIRLGAIWNPSTPVHALESALAGPETWEALSNPAIPIKTLERVLANTSLREIRVQVLGNWGFPAENVENFWVKSKKPSLSALVSTARHPFVGDDWYLGISNEIQSELEEGSPSARAMDIYSEAVIELSRNPGVTYAAWEEIVDSHPWLLEERPELRDRKCWR
jgi:hypothetical protein